MFRGFETASVSKPTERAKMKFLKTHMASGSGEGHESKSAWSQLKSFELRKRTYSNQSRQAACDKHLWHFPKKKTHKRLFPKWKVGRHQDLATRAMSGLYTIFDCLKRTQSEGWSSRFSQRGRANQSIFYSWLIDHWLAWMFQNLALGQKENPTGDQRFWSIFSFTNRVFGVPFLDP